MPLSMRYRSWALTRHRSGDDCSYLLRRFDKVRIGKVGVARRGARCDAGYARGTGRRAAGRGGRSGQLVDDCSQGRPARTAAPRSTRSDGCGAWVSRREPDADYDRGVGVALTASVSAHAGERNANSCRFSPRLGTRNPRRRHTVRSRVGGAETNPRMRRAGIRDVACACGRVSAEPVAGSCTRSANDPRQADAIVLVRRRHSRSKPAPQHAACA